MAELKPLAEFPALIVRVKTLVDKGIRAELDLPETMTEMLSTLHALQRDDRPLRVIIYDDEEFERAIRKRN